MLKKVASAVSGLLHICSFNGYELNLLMQQPDNS